MNLQQTGVKPFELSWFTQAEKVDTLPNGRQLTYGEYRDASRPLRRCLKQLGSGSLEQGMAAALQQESSLMEVSQLIGIDSQVGTSTKSFHESVQHWRLSKVEFSFIAHEVERDGKKESLGAGHLEGLEAHFRAARAGRAEHTRAVAHVVRQLRVQPHESGK